MARASCKNKEGQGGDPKTCWAPTEGGLVVVVDDSLVLVVVLLRNAKGALGLSGQGGRGNGSGGCKDSGKGDELHGGVSVWKSQKVQV